MRSAPELLAELNALDESVQIEAKKARDIGKSVQQTVCAFANEPGLGGGYLLLGVEWERNEKGDVVYWPAGLADPDKLQSDLASQCASMFNVVLRPEMQVESIDGKPMIVVFVPEADVAHKPIYFKATGLPGGAYRRIGSADHRCADEDLWVLRGESEPQSGPDKAIVQDATRDDFDPQAIAEYRRLRANLNPGAEELAYGDDELLEAVGALRRTNDALKPTVAGIVLFGQSLALRRLMPALRIDYIRVNGTQWLEDPEERFVATLDVRKPLLLALRQLQSTILDDLPRGFRLDEGELQSRQEPILPDKVIREALANATMHRSYQVNSPVQIIRYSNRIEVLNPGYSLKPVADLGTPGSRLRNPTIAAVLHDLHWAETKGSGIRVMRRLSTQAGLPPPEFSSAREQNEFKATLFLHNLLTEQDHQWLKRIATTALSGDEAKILLYARETGAVNNTACRDFSGLDTLNASAVLRRLRDRGLLIKQGAGNRTYYTLRDPLAAPEPQPEQARLPLFENEAPVPPTRAGRQPTEEGCNLEHATLPPELATLLAAQTSRLDQKTLRQLIIRLCAWRPLTGEELATFLNKKRDYLRNKHLSPMVSEGQLKLRYPESAQHPHQAYVASEPAQEDQHE